jgi:hypothetical protein
VNPLSESEAAAVWQVLVDHAGASDHPYDGEVFVHCQTVAVEREWRFCGSLGGGGKFRRNRVWIGDTRTESWTVDCYREDVAPDRQAVIDKTNEALAELRKEVTR